MLKFCRADFARFVLCIGFGSLMVLGMLASRAAAGSLKTLYSFCTADACTDGFKPNSGLMRDSTGNLYGVVPRNSGSFNTGLIYALIKHGKKYKFAAIHRFCQGDDCTDGNEPVGSLITDVAGNLYGTTTNAGANGGGTVFRLEPNKNKTKWKLETLYSFCSSCASGGIPVAGLTYQGAKDGIPYDGHSSLYGVTFHGGANDGGVAFRLSFDNRKVTYTVLHDFCLDDTCSDGKWPESSLVMDSKGNLFGTTTDGGYKDQPGGTAFEISPGGQTTTLYQFCQHINCTDGTFPHGPLSIDGSGNILGTTLAGGKNRAGTVFRIKLKGQHSTYRVIHNFCSVANCVDGFQPEGAVLDVNGDLVGVADRGGKHGNNGDGGTVFRLHGEDLTTLYSFCAKELCRDGSNPVTGVVLDAAGDVFGATNAGGEHFEGSIFELVP